MSDVVLSIEWSGAGCRLHSVRIAGIIIGSRDTGDGSFETTVIFLPGSGRNGGPKFRHLPN